MKLLFVLSEYLPDSGGGIISYYAGVLPRLVSAGHLVDVLVASTEKLNQPTITVDGVHISYLKREFLEKFQIGFERYKVGYPSFIEFLPLAWAAYEQVGHGVGYDLVETTDFPLLFAPWVVSRDSPPVNVSLHGSCGQLDWYNHPSRQTIDADVLRLVERAALSSAKSVQANSDTNASFWCDQTNRNIKVLLPLYPDCDRVAVVSQRQAEGLVIGRLQNFKGPDVLCRALEAIPEVCMRWIGRDVIDENGQLTSQSLRKRYPKIFGMRLFHQNGVAHKQALCEIAAASFLCIPSTWDVFNLTVVEAMALGTPVICSLKAGASMLIHHGENGFLFDPEKPWELVECIKRINSLTATERTNLTENARNTLHQRMDPVRLLEERMDYYEAVASRTEPALCDEWLSVVLAARNGKTERLEILRAFTVKELVAATGWQMADGIRRRLT